MGVFWRALTAATAAVLGAPVQALAPPDQGEIGLRQLHYEDRQPAKDRITVKGWAVDALVPLGERWLLEGYGVVDAISGASPSYYTAPSSLTPLVDRRRAYDLRVSHLASRSRLTVGVARSREADYLSASHALTYARASDDQNRTWTFGVSHTADRIDPVTRVVTGERKTTREWLLGWTQVLTPRDLVQLQATHADGSGYFSDPYKLFDKRPDKKRQTALLARWNHHLPGPDATLRVSARAYRDSFGLSSATVSAEWAQALGAGWSLTPGVRAYAQTAASFFSPPDPLAPDVPRLNPGYVFGRSLISMDQRLAGLGALTVSARLEKRLAGGHSLVLKLERYEQRTAWDWLGGGGAALRDFHARMVQVGYTHRWDR